MNDLDFLSIGARKARQVSEREIALTLVLMLAQSNYKRFALQQFYDDDMEFIDDVRKELNIEFSKAWDNKLAKVVRRLVNYGVFESRMSSTQKEYVGEPAKQRDYWLPPGKRDLINRGQTDYTMTPEGEVKFLLRRAYPDPVDD